MLILVLPIIQYIEWRFSHYPRIYDFLLVLRETRYKRIRALYSCFYSKSNGRDDYKWLLEGDDAKFEIK